MEIVACELNLLGCVSHVCQASHMVTMSFIYFHCKRVSIFGFKKGSNTQIFGSSESDPKNVTMTLISFIQTFGSKLVWSEYLVHLNHILTPTFEHFVTIRPRRRWQLIKRLGCLCMCVCVWGGGGVVKDFANQYILSTYFTFSVFMCHRNKRMLIFHTCCLIYIFAVKITNKNHQHTSSKTKIIMFLINGSFLGNTDFYLTT